MQVPANPVDGTLLWIGDRCGPSFSLAYQYCEERCSQIAWRADAKDAVERPAGGVQWLILTQANTLPMPPETMDRLADQYLDARRLQLLGELCGGIGRTPDSFFGHDRHYSHRWNQVVPAMFNPLPAMSDRSDDIHRGEQSPLGSVLIMASGEGTAGALLDVAQSGGMTAVWSRHAAPISMRNFDTVWWDDSVASPTSAVGWKRRIASLGQSDRMGQHVWIANAPRHEAVRHAIAGGVNRVVSKPYRLNVLLATLGSREAHSCAGTVLRRMAA